ncbi:MAG TPA: MarR family transcriptional regulator [Plantibacter sp.]|uniref:MarR family winged helix-turn-helix transcriptional regulator n=1 Tax=Plantibacter sp. TaxID=1871045 RepID=UPI002C4CD266|nr:MarR family transcriptional regulator [Plantibacter sp.]
MDDGLADLLHRIVAILGDLARDRMAADQPQLTYTQLRFIGTLEEAPGTTQHRLAESLGLSDAAASRALRGLQEAGYVEIVTDPAHARRRLVSATQAGKDVFHATGVSMATELRDWLIRQDFPYERYLSDSRHLAALLSSDRRSSPGVKGRTVLESPA